MGWPTALMLLIAACVANPTMSVDTPAGLAAMTTDGLSDFAAANTAAANTASGTGATFANTASDTASAAAAGRGGDPNPPPPGGLVGYGSCDGFLNRIRTEALERVGPYGLDTGAPYGSIGVPDSVDVVWATDAAESTATTVRAAQENTAAAVAYSATNVQEVGVDEPDIIKSDGTRILTVTSGTLHYIDLSSGTPEVVAALDPWSEPDQPAAAAAGVFGTSRMFLSGDAAFLIGEGYNHDNLGDVTRVVRVDLSDPADLTVTSTLTVEARYVAARQVGEQITLVLASSPHGRVPFVYPASRRAEAKAEAVNRATVTESAVGDWVPRYEHRGGGTRTAGLFVDCGSAYAPERFAGFDLLSVATLNTDGEWAHPNTTVATVMSGGDTVYASAQNLYVATVPDSRDRWVGEPWVGVPWRTEPWAVWDTPPVREPADSSTHIHQFGIGGPAAHYMASGAVDGHLIGQFAMSEHGNHLRVASTTGGSPWDRRAPTSQVSRVDVLTRDGDQLVTVGSVAGLGKGERIYAVRFIGDMGYVVTFRETDPLYTVDLSDPTDPQTLGELKIPGYSAYLHPLSDGRLLGVGQDADDQGRTRGTQASIFDVSDPADPTRVAQFTLKDAYSDAEWDHHAFLYWPPDEIVVIPVSWWEEPRRGGWERRAGALVLSASGNQLEQVALIEHEPHSGGGGGWVSSILRSLVVDDTLFTMSGDGLLGSELGTFDTTSWTWLEPSR